MGDQTDLEFDEGYEQAILESCEEMGRALVRWISRSVSAPSAREAVLRRVIKAMRRQAKEGSDEGE